MLDPPGKKMRWILKLLYVGWQVTTFFAAGRPSFFLKEHSTAVPAWLPQNVYRNLSILLISPFNEHPLLIYISEKAMAPHSSTLAWKIPWMEEPGRLWGREESDTTERLYFQFSLSCIGEGNGNPLQCSCLENPRYRGAGWAAVYGVTQSRTRLKRLSRSSSSSNSYIMEFPW